MSTTYMTIEEIISVQKPEDLFGELPEDLKAARKHAESIWRSAVREFHPDVNDDPRAQQAIRVINQMLDKVRAGRYGVRNIDVLIRTKRHGYKLTTMVTQGDVANLYGATYTDANDDPQNAIVKIVRDRSNNDLLANEAKTLKRLLSNTDTFDELSPYMPRYIETFGYRLTAPGKARSGPAQSRQAIAFNFTPNLYTLQQVRQTYPNGVHAKDAAWMFRRILYALSLVHTNGIVHGALLPQHILIEPDQHGIVLVDWKHSTELGQRITSVPTGARNFYPPEIFDKEPSTFGMDLYMAAMCMGYVMGPDPTQMPRQINAFLRGTAMPRAKGRPQDALALRDEYTELIERLWGPRVFRPFTM